MLLQKREFNEIGYDFSLSQKTGWYFSPFTEHISLGELSNLNAFSKNYTKFNLTPYTPLNTLQTKFSEVKFFHDIFDDNDKIGFGELSSNAMLFNFDSNGTVC